ncbi:MAG TPA: amino acid ABC transporter substrate-binding protein, partial [Dehalococcoidia bacterium]|nr:amino acid ABC transporter substrate-binding protein [Dehalococcoidia bacterium]
MAGGVKAGIPVSLSGQFQAQGRQALAGLHAWAQYANQTGGVWVAGRHARLPVTVVHYDDASRASLARGIAERLVLADRVDLLFGPYSSGLTAAVAPVAEEHGHVLWNQGGASQRVYQQGYRWVVGVLTPANEYLAGLLPLVREAAPQAATLAVVRASSGEFPRAVSAGVEGQAAALGFNVVLEQEYPPATADFSGVLDNVAGARPDVLVAVGRIRHDLALARQLVSRRLPLMAAAVVAAPIQQFRDALKADVQGFLGPSQWEESVNYVVDYEPATQQVLESLRQAGVQSADYPAAQACAAGLVAQRCVEEAGALDQEALRAAASGLDMTTFYG